MRPVTEGFAVSPQLPPHALARAAAEGVGLVINNRPDDEEPGQPSSAEMAAGAAAAGIAYAHIPVRGMPSESQVAEMSAAIDAAEGDVLAFCRSGARSVLTWALGRQASGILSRDEALALAREAGYDLSAYLPR